MVRIGILCPSEIAFRRFLPALGNCKEFSYVGVAVADCDEWFGDTKPDEMVCREVLGKELEKAKSFQENYGGKIFLSYRELIESDEIDAVYIPLPPALHYKWAKTALLSKKHVMVEKPATTENSKTEELIAIASEHGLALHENYMFAFHRQLEEISEMVAEKKLGDVRLYRINFGFPRRAKNDFRYAKKLGGGALLDCGGYTLKYASMLLGDTARIAYANLNYTDEFDVDLYGSAALVNDAGETVQVSFGMDNSYKCELEVWGSTATLQTGRVLTAPAGFVPSYTITDNQGVTNGTFSADDTFSKSLNRFLSCVNDEKTRTENYEVIHRQALLVDEFIKKAVSYGK